MTDEHQGDQDNPREELKAMDVAVKRMRATSNSLDEDFKLMIAEAEKVKASVSCEKLIDGFDQFILILSTLQNTNRIIGNQALMQLNVIASHLLMHHVETPEEAKSEGPGEMH